MYMKCRIFVVAALVCLTAVSCGPKVRSIGQQTIQFVRSILGDSESPEYKILKSYDPALRDAAIYVIGDDISCSFVSKELKNSDDGDNIDGIGTPDGLPDFAGERIAVVTDIANGSYDSLVLEGKTEILRELTVRTLLKTVDTLCYLSPFDNVGLGHKSAAKMLVISSPAASAYGYFDVDSLLRASACELPVVSPMSIAMAEAVDREGITVVVATSAERSETDIYQKLCETAAHNCGFNSVSCVSIPVSGPAMSFSAILDSYSLMENGRPVDVLLIDDMVLSSDGVENELERIRSVMNAEYQKYSEFLSPDFRIVRSAPLLRRECYRILREKNLFTHKVAYPVIESYMNVQRDSLSGISSNILIEYNSMYLPK